MDYLFFVVCPIIFIATVLGLSTWIVLRWKELETPSAIIGLIFNLLIVGAAAGIMMSKPQQKWPHMSLQNAKTGEFLSYSTFYNGVQEQDTVIVQHGLITYRGVLEYISSEAAIVSVESQYGEDKYCLRLNLKANDRRETLHITEIYVTPCGILDVLGYIVIEDMIMG